MAFSAPTGPRYRIVEIIGRGGMGEVCLADDVMLDRQVALKFVAATAETDALEQLLGEARAAAALDHPFICSIYEVTALDARPCLRSADPIFFRSASCSTSWFPAQTPSSAPESMTRLSPYSTSQSRRAAQAAATLDRELGQLDHLPVPLVVIAQIHQCRGELSRAQDAYREALALAEKTGEPQLLLPCYDGLATICLDQREFESTFTQMKGQFLIDRDGIVRWTHIECDKEGLAGMGKFPRTTSCSAPRALSSAAGQRWVRSQAAHIGIARLYTNEFASAR